MRSNGLYSAIPSSGAHCQTTIVQVMMSFITMTEPKRRRGALRAPDQLGKENPSSSRISVYCQRHVPVGRRCCSGARGIYRTPTSWRSSAAADRSADPVADAHDIFISRVPARVGFLAGLEAPPASAQGCSANFADRDLRSGGVELFLLPGDSEDERGDRHHPAIHGTDLGLAVRRL